MWNDLVIIVLEIDMEENKGWRVYLWLVVSERLCFVVMFFLGDF